MLTESDIRQRFAESYVLDDFVTDKSGVAVLEILNASFLTSAGVIFGKQNPEYVERELQWYLSQSLKVADIPGKVPAIWQAIAGKTTGEINSNYGWCIFSRDNGLQYCHTLAELQSNPASRRAVMIYTRPSMHLDYKRDDMSDFICTNTVQYFIRRNKLHTSVSMRSNDSWAGYRNDWAWQDYVRRRLYLDLLPNYPNLDLGDMFWNVGSLHLYSSQFYLVEHFIKTGEYAVSKADIQALI